MTYEEIIKIFRKRGVAFNVITLDRNPDIFLARRIMKSADPNEVIFLTAEGQKPFLPDNVKSVNPVSCKDLLKRIHCLEKRFRVAKERTQSAF